MDIRKLQKIAVAALEDIKAKDIEVINTNKLTSMFDRLIIASGDSTRQVKALARNVREKVEEAGGNVIGIEGEESSEWVLVDLGDIVVHVMQPAVRAYYNIEELWTTKPKRVTSGRSSPEGEADQSPSSSGRSRGFVEQSSAPTERASDAARAPRGQRGRPGNAARGKEE